MLKLAAALLASLLLAPAPTPKYVALTFDDGPSGRYTSSLLDGLREREVQATFLLCGYRMEQYPDLTRRILEDGHEIGLHGYAHKPMDTMTPVQLAAELHRCKNLVPEECELAFLRPPGGKQSARVRQAAADAGLSLLGWNVDPRDWATHRPEQVETAVVQTVHDGDIILLHDMSDSSVQAALSIIDTLLAQGYTFVTVSQLAALREIALQPGKLYSRFPPG